MREIFNFLNFGKKEEKRNREVSKNFNFGNLKIKSQDRFLVNYFENVLKCAFLGPVTDCDNFSFLSISTLPVILFFMNLFCSSSFYITPLFCIFLKVEKLNISDIYKSIITIFSVNLPLVYAYMYICLQAAPPYLNTKGKFPLVRTE